MTDDAVSRTFGPSPAPEDAAGKPAPAQRLVGIAVPRRVGPYFATDDQDPVPLGEFAAAAGHGVARAECTAWARLGGDNGYELCTDADATVRAVLLDYAEADRFVNSAPEAFAAGLQELRGALGVILSSDQPRAAAVAFDRLADRLRSQDPEAFADDAYWWPLVLDDIRDTAGAENYAAFEYIHPVEGKQIVTQSGAIALHPEERLWANLQAAGVEAEAVLRIHTDLEPCFLPGHYCSMWLAEVFPHAEMTHSFPYGESPASRAEGIRRLRAYAQEQERTGGR